MSAVPEFLCLDELVIIQKKAVLVNEFFIYDHTGRHIGLAVESSSMKDFLLRSSRGVTISTVDADGKPVEAALVVEDPINWLHDTYEVRRPGEEEALAILRKEFTFFRPRYTLMMRPLGEIDIQGDFWGWDYRLTAEKSQLASITRDAYTLGTWVTGKDTYRISMNSELGTQERACVVGAVIALDMAHTKQREND